MPRVAHFEIMADEPVRAAKFYSAVFGWEIKKWDGPFEYWMVMTGDKNEPGIDGGLMKRMGGTATPGAPSNAFVCTMVVDSVDTYIERIVAEGGSIVKPKYALPMVGYLAYALDTEGNCFGIMQDDKSAK